MIMSIYKFEVHIPLWFTMRHHDILSTDNRKLLYKYVVNSATGIHFTGKRVIDLVIHGTSSIVHSLNYAKDIASGCLS